MSWFKRTRKTLQGAGAKKPVPDGLWRKCDYCSEILYNKELEKRHWVCPKCDYHFTIGTGDYIDLLCDPGSFEETHQDLKSGDPLKFKDTKRYSDRLKQYEQKSGRGDAVVTGYATVEGRGIVLCIMDFSFMGGSMGSVVGEKIARATQDAIARRRALIIVSRSGGARMQESIFSLMQMAKTSAMLQALCQAGLPFFSILTNPTTGGVTASFASLGDVIIAEPKALIGFAGPRVIQQTIRQDLPEGFQRSEFLLEHGMIDMIRPRARLRETIHDLIDFFSTNIETQLREDGKDEEESPAVS